MESLDKLRSCFDNYAILNTVTAKKVVRDLADEIEREVSENYVGMPTQGGIGMESLNRARKAFGMYTNIHTETGVERVDDLFDAIERELKEHYVLLPLDKDGVPIHIGEEMVDDKKDRFVVREIDFTDTCIRVFATENGIQYIYEPSKIVHYHKNPIEDMLRNLVTKARQIDVDGSPMLKENDIRELSDKLQLKEES